MAPVQRGWLGTWLDQYIGWKYGLPAETCSYTIDRVHVPMPDGVELVADLYQPQVPKPLGTVLVRTPYGLALPMSFGLARLIAARGYVVLFNACRGTDESGGAFDPGRDEMPDGQATVAWMREQSWYTGSFATTGASYLGYTQWCQLVEPPADMKAAIISTGPHDLSRFIWGTGALNSDFIGWGDVMTRVRKSSLPLMLWLMLPRPSLSSVFSSTPLLAGIDTHFSSNAPNWLRHMVTHPDLSDPYWEPLQHGAGVERANIPILLIGGWDDLILPETMHQYETLHRLNRDVALTVGPWTHVQAAGLDTMGETLTWLDRHLAGKHDRVRPSPVRVFITGASEWRELPSWPPTTKSYKLVLGPGTLATEPSASGLLESKFIFDPSDPTPDTGATALFRTHLDEDTALAARSDVLTFTTEALSQALEVYGKPTVRLYHSCNKPYADLLVRVSEVNVNGASRCISERFLRLDQQPRREGDPLELSLRDCAHRFAKGSKIRLFVAGGSYPRYLRNLGTGDNPGTGKELSPVEHTIRHSASTLSSINLPVAAL